MMPAVFVSSFGTFMGKMPRIISREWFIDTRRLLHLSQTELADLLEVDRKTIWRWENAESMTVPKLAGLALLYLEKNYERVDKSKTTTSNVTAPFAIVPETSRRTPAAKDSL
jgi:transcriptional regulator with XRE-family HTH domain